MSASIINLAVFSRQHETRRHQDLDRNDTQDHGRPCTIIRLGGLGNKSPKEFEGLHRFLGSKEFWNNLVFEDL